MGNQRTADRRKHGDRRQSGDRRRQSDTRFAVVEVCRSTLHLALVIRQSGGAPDKLITRTLQWRDEASSLHSDRGTQELTDAFRTLITDERLAGAGIRITLGGEFCVTRVLTGTTEDVRREFAELEERSLRYLTLGPGRKALAGSFQALDARHQYALLTVANQKTLDLLMKIAETVGFQIEAIEPSLVALSRAQANLHGGCREACLLIQVDEGAAELGICHGGRLLLDYRPGGNTNAENVADVVAQHFSRLQRYLERYHSYLNSPLTHVYLTGEPASVERARQKLAKFRQFNVEVLNPADLNSNWQHAGDMPGTNLAAALGSALLVRLDAAEQQGPNLIASTLAELRPPLRPIIIRALMPLAAVLLAATTLLVLHLRELRSITALQAEMDELAPICARATELRLKNAAADAKLAQLAALEQRLPQPNWQQIVGRITQSMPDDVWLDRFTVQDGKHARLTGASYTDSGVYDFVSNLKQVPDLAEIALEGTGVGQSPTGPTTNFDLQLTLANFAGRNESEKSHD
jgi:hypothetical protein